MLRFFLTFFILHLLTIDVDSSLVCQQNIRALPAWKNGPDLAQIHGITRLL